MATVHDVAAYILQQQGSTTTMKLQKLCYYSQGWHLAWDEEPLFQEDFQSWESGPVCYELFEEHKGLLMVSNLQKGNPDALTVGEKETVDAVCENYRDYTGMEMNQKARMERPWIEAQRDCKPGKRCETVISKDTMQDFFAGLAQEDR